MISRRNLVKISAGALAAPALVERVGAQSAFDWKQCKGQHIEVSLTKNPRGDLLQGHQKEFEELTGISVGSEQIPEQQQRPKMVLELSTGRPSFDVTHYSLHVSKRVIGAGHWLEDLRPYLANPALTAPGYDFADVGAGPVRAATQPDGRIDSLPLESDFWLLYYNKAMFAAKGIAYPATYADMLEAARKLADPSKGIAGFVGRGLKNANTPLWTCMMLGQGIQAVAADGRTLQTDTPEAIAAGELYKSLMRDAGPAGIVGFNWNECQTSFMQGRAAMWLDGVGFAPPLIDPKRSKVAADVGFGVLPAGPKTRATGFFTDALGVPVKSQVRNAAYLYCQWATGKAMETNLVREGGGASPRLSTYDDPSLRQAGGFGQEWLTTLQESAKIAQPGLPEIIPVNEFRDVFGVALTNMIGGADTASELRKATETFRPILEKSLNG